MTIRCVELSARKVLYVMPERVKMIKARDREVLLILEWGEVAVIYRSVDCLMAMFPNVWARLERGLAVRNAAISHIHENRVYLINGDTVHISKRQLTKIHHASLRRPITKQ